MTQVRNRLETRVQEAGLTVYKLTVRSGVSGGTIDAYIRGQNLPTYRTARKLGIALKVPPETILAECLQDRWDIRKARGTTQIYALVENENKRMAGADAVAELQALAQAPDLSDDSRRKLNQAARTVLRVLVAELETAAGES